MILSLQPCQPFVIANTSLQINVGLLDRCVKVNSINLQMGEKPNINCPPRAARTHAMHPATDSTHL